MLAARDNFYLTLPSNASSTIRPCNKPQAFTVELAQPIELEGKWEAALTEIQFPNNWYNITEDCKIEISIQIPLDSPTPAPIVPVVSPDTLTAPQMDSMATSHSGADPVARAAAIRQQIAEDVARGRAAKAARDAIEAREEEAAQLARNVKTMKVTIPRGNYQSVDSLCNHMNELFSKQYEFDNAAIKNKFKFEHPMKAMFNPEHKRVEFKSDFAVASFKIAKDAQLTHMLGIAIVPDVPATKIFEITLPHSSNLEPALFQNYPAIYVYSNVVRVQMVGNTFAPLMRTVPIVGKKADIISETFFRPYYLPVDKGYIRSIEVELRNDAGELIEFQAGKVILVIHFRRCGLGL